MYRPCPLMIVDVRDPNNSIQLIMIRTFSLWNIFSDITDKTILDYKLESHASANFINVRSN